MTAGPVLLLLLTRACAAHGTPPDRQVYAFSLDNWQREEREVSFLLRLFSSALAQQLPELQANGVRLTFMGELERLPAALQQQMAACELATAPNDGLLLSIAVSYRCVRCAGCCMRGCIVRVCRCVHALLRGRVLTLARPPATAVCRFDVRACMRRTAARTTWQRRRASSHGSWPRGSCCPSRCACCLPLLLLLCCRCR